MRYSKQEQWRAIPDYEGRYDVSDQGRIRSLVGPGRMGLRKTPKLLQIIPARSRANQVRCVVSLNNSSGRRKRYYVGRLVLLAFCGPCPEGMECCHWDDDQFNNTLSNLRWDTKLGNARDKIRNGKQIAGEAHHRSKLKKAQVKRIKCRLAQGESQTKLASEYEVWRGTVNSISKGRTWRDV